MFSTADSHDSLSAVLCVFIIVPSAVSHGVTFIVPFCVPFMVTFCIIESFDFISNP